MQDVMSCFSKCLTDGRLTILNKIVPYSNGGEDLWSQYVIKCIRLRTAKRACRQICGIKWQISALYGQRERLFLRQVTPQYKHKPLRNLHVTPLTPIKLKCWLCVLHKGQSNTDYYRKGIYIYT